DDAVIAKLDLADIGYAVSYADLALRVLHPAGCVGYIDGVVAHAFAELLEATTRTTGADDRCLELGEGGAEFLGHDGGEGQYGRGSCDLDGVPRLRGGT